MTTNQPTMLLAKSRRHGKEITLQRHLFETEQAAAEVFTPNGRWGRNWCRLFKLTGRERQESFLLHLRLAALLHDIGKANEDFYAAVTRPTFFPQTLRHEHLSALLLHLPEVRSWLRQNPSLDLEVLTGAVLSHHVKASEADWCQPKTKTVLQLFYTHPEVNVVLDRIKEVARLPNELRLRSNVWANKMPWSEAWEDGQKTARQFIRDLRRNEWRRSLLMAVKAGLIVADAVASGLVREGHDIEGWINDRVHSAPISEADVADSILDPKARQLSKGRPFDWHEFQKRAATLGPRALLLAACGAGKTVAAWKWAEAQAREREIGKVIFLYPTRGTATEGFRDYVGFAPEDEAGLLHGTARYELDAMAENPSEATRGKNYETEERLFALGFWSKRYFSATVDQFLGFMEHSYTGLCLLPVLADSALIIDEVHSFDRHMFDNLICFLKTFDVPVLCMTATLPCSRRGELIEAGLRVYPTPEERLELADLEEKERHPRYKLEHADDESAALKIAAAEYESGKRVLWVVNTVSRCQRAARRLFKEHSIKPLVYHSRFRLRDRKDRHAETVAAFKQTVEAKIAITTQVCEMSLDLDADILITEHAPVSSLVQRFGRANRSPDRDPTFRARLIVYKPEANAPYTERELSEAANFLRELGSGGISQRLLAEKLEEHSPPQRAADGSARLLEGGYYATPGSFRDVDEFTRPCVLDRREDLAELKACLAANKSYDALVINVPEKFSRAMEDRPGWLPKYLGVASERFYDPDYGFMTELEEGG
jgi:CRISPR-associated endonuclease/helicase Cas3